MISINFFDQIYFYRPYIDFRNGIHGLCALVQDELKMDLFSKNLYIFSNRQRNKLKALYWDQTGFALWIKYLLEDKYKWPVHFEEDVIKVNIKNLENFLIGFDPFQIPFKEKKYTKV